MTMQNYYQTRRAFLRQSPHYNVICRHNHRAHKCGAKGRLHHRALVRFYQIYHPVCLRCGATECLSLDHIVPLCRGGRGDISNLQLLCVGCNSSKREAIADYRRPWQKVQAQFFNDYYRLKKVYRRALGRFKEAASW